MTVLLANNVSTSLAAPLSAVATSMTVTNGSRFPVLSAGQYFYATIIATNGVVEIVKVVTRNGNAMAITRAQDGTNAQAFASGSRVEMRINAAAITETVTDRTGPLDTRLTTAEANIVTLDGRLDIAEPEIDALQVFDAVVASSAGSNSVGFLQAGTGATTRTVQTKLRDVVSVKDFGAVGDGVADDTAAIQAAIDTGAASIYVPAGAYKLTGTINISQPINFFGAGKNATVFTLAGTFDAFYINGGVSVITGMQMRDFKITNTLPRVSVTDGAGIRMYLSYFGVFNNILIHNCYYGIRSRQSNVTRYNAVDVTDFNYVGYLFSGGFNFDSYVANCAISGGSAGFASVKLEDMCDEMVFYSVIMNTSQYNLHCDATAFGVNLRPEFCRFFACSFDSSTTGVFLRHTSDMTFTGCFFSNRPGNGAQIGTTAVVENTHFIGCSFYNCGGSGIVVGEYATDTLFDGCNFIGNSQATANTGNGVTIAANTLNFTVTNSTFRNGWGSSGSQNYGLAVLSGTSDRFTITNNNFGTNGTGGAMLLGASGTNRTVSGNVGVKTKASGEATILTGNTSVIVTHGLFAQPASSDIILTPALLPAVAVYVSALSATTFTISTVSPVASNLRVNWVAAILGN